jgi:lipid II:glycine glycyltransferase (peptidoglycan interpeptide bridge formation enzyme)
MYSHSLINSYEKPGTLGGPYLTWFALQWAKQNGMRYYDFSGGEAPSDEGIEQYQKRWGSLLTYKKKWGGQELPYYHLVKIRKRLSYKAMRALLKVDWAYRSYKKKKYEKTV